MRVFLNCFIFFIFFTLEIRVKASNPPLQKPENCYSSELKPCIFSSGNKIIQVQNRKTVFNLKENTTLERLNEKNFQFMGGTVWVQNQEPLEISTLYAAISSTKGEFWLVEKDNKIFVRSIVGQTDIKINSGVLNLPEGFQIWISGKDSQGKNTYGVPEIIPMEEHLRLWSTLFSGSREEFKNKVKMLKDLYKDTAYEGGELYQKIADRHVATLEEKKRAEQASSERRRAYLQEIRRLYFEKVFQR